MDVGLRDALRITIAQTVSRMETLVNVEDRRCLFQEYKEWLGEEINDEVLFITALDKNHK